MFDPERKALSHFWYLRALVDAFRAKKVSFEIPKCLVLPYQKSPIFFVKVTSNSIQKSSFSSRNWLIVMTDRASTVGYYRVGMIIGVF